MKEPWSPQLAALNVPLSISHQILPEFREYERASTVLVNAYLQPVMQGLICGSCRKDCRRDSDTSTGKRWALPQVFVMQSSGGITALATAAEQPVRTVFPGPPAALWAQPP